jgi:type I restriction enzyme R subunit
MAQRANRYDVTVLVNGLPMVHVEFKRRGVDIREAFNQINRYQRDSFWAGCGLFEYVQLFVISNGTLTKYYSNTVRDGHLAEQGVGKRSKSKTSNSFSFTSWWADARNQPITELMSFAKTFFARHSLLNVLTRTACSTWIASCW